MAQVNDNDDIKWLYGKLKAKGYNIGSEAEFKSSLANGEDRKWYYEKAKGMGLDMGSMDDFESMYAPEAAPAPKRETPSSGQRKPASAVSASPEQPKKQKPKGTPMTEQDKIRMDYLCSQGLYVFRISNLDVARNFEGVCTAVDELVKARTR